MGGKSGIQATGVSGRATPPIPWRTVLVAGAEDSAVALDLTSGGYSLSEMQASPSFTVIDLEAIFGHSYGNLVLAFWAEALNEQTVTENDAFGFDILLYRNSIGEGEVPMLMATVVANAAIVGTMPRNDISGAFWIDTLVLAFSAWIAEVEVFDSATNRCAWMICDPAGSRFMVINRFGVDGAQAAKPPAVGVCGFVY